MEYTHDDAGLARQPIGYWAPTAGRAVVAHIRGALGVLGLNQPQWWVLSQLTEHPDGKARKELSAFLQGYLEEGATLDGDIDSLVSRGLVQEDGPLLRVTTEGGALQARAAARQQAVREEIHAGIPDEEYVRTVKVLQRMIHNVGAKAWHH
ncbi:MarR family winged helix-turn-helix transcriptional regulator [Streptomyces sp. H27-C3]|uniref:MarR family winged helix-turn-helix transcriptional regulator n=1 Tax=Streptomyces sp. H27-C3 TaxID=3046305 RepID=UPI0024BB2A5B|nr:MarR family winged helix-turn-helix transcriptional regulator [Streptomyces sp. H27-C3]MDJ0464112.1 MarR family winged helix-turn-helix transcriptional regulator [Streptomyces sp. H27-C3]